MSVTAKQLTNRVLRALREIEIDSSTTTLSDDLHVRVWQFCNKARQEIEQAHKWRALRQQISATVTASTGSVVLTDTNEHSLLMYDECGRPMVFDVTDSSNPYQLLEVQLARLRRWDYLDNGQTAEIPGWCNVDADDDNLILRVWPYPTADRSYQLECFVPQGELDHTDSDDVSASILVPARPVELLALAYALEERGEELGERGEVAFQRAHTAINEAIAQDYQAQASMNGPGQYDLQVV